MDPIWDVFLSHGSPDKPWVENLAAELRSLGLRPFLDAREIEPGDSFPHVLSAREPAETDEERAELFARATTLGSLLFDVLFDKTGREHGNRQDTRATGENWGGAYSE